MSTSVRTLTEAMCEHRLTEVELDTLNQLLADDAEARRQYIQQIHLHVSLQHAVGNQRSTIRVQPETKPTLPALSRVEGRRSRSVWYATMALAAAVILTTGVALTVLLFSDSTTPNADANGSSQGIALLPDLDNATFADAATPAVLGSELPREPLRLESGRAQVMFKSGAVVEIMGPSDFQALGPNQGQLTHGTVVAFVPPSAQGFTITTPRGIEVIDLGTRFALRVEPGGQTRVDVLSGRVILSLDGQGRTLSAGQAMAVGQAGSPRPVQWDSQPWRATGLIARGPIELGNLFDDAKRQPLEHAAATDTYHASAEATDLGVHRIAQGGSAVQNIGSNVTLDLTALGWSRDKFGSITNDAWNSGEGDQQGAIRTEGHREGDLQDRTEQGIGMHANALIVFDLDELRQAGRLTGQPMRWISDRAGVNDDRFGMDLNVRLAAIVIDDAGIVAAQVNGQPVTARPDARGVWHFDSPMPSPLKADGRYARFDMPIAPSARYLTLIATGAHDVDGSIGNDHTVFSGARLEIETFEKQED